MNVDHLFKRAVISALYIPQAGDVGVSFNGNLMMELLKKFLSLEGEFLFPLLSDPGSLKCWNGEGIIDGCCLKCPGRPDVRLVLTSDQVQQVLLHLYGIIKPKAH